MTRRLLYLCLGTAAGVLAVRRASLAAGGYAPEGLQEPAAGSFGELGDTVREFVEEVRIAMAEREAELRSALGLDGTHDAVDADL